MGKSGIYASICSVGSRMLHHGHRAERPEDTPMKTLTIELPERLDSSNALDWEDELPDVTSGVDELVMDCSNCTFISSAGLRVLLTLKSNVGLYTPMILDQCSPKLMEVFSLTGFDRLFTLRAKEI